MLYDQVQDNYPVSQDTVSQEKWSVDTPSTPEVAHENSPTVADKPSQKVEVPQFPSLIFKEEALYRRRSYNPTDASFEQ